jgi:hypothetical protein
VTLAVAMLVLGEAFPTSITARQGKSLDGGFSAWAVECVSGCSGGTGGSGGASYVLDAGVLNVNPHGISGQVSVNIVDAGAPLNVNLPATMPPTPVTGPISVNILDAGPPLNINPPATLPLPTGAATSGRQDTANTSLANLDVALSTRTKPSDQQHVIVDSSASLAVTGPLTDTQLRATAVPVSLATAPTTPVTGTFFQATQPVSGTVAVASVGGTTAVSAAALPLPAGAATDATLSQLLDGGVLQLGRSPLGLVMPVAVDVSGAQYVVVPLPMRNPFLPRCNPVRRTGCQP